jgi:endonuclease YncB( thermonuclease family)
MGRSSRDTATAQLDPAEMPRLFRQNKLTSENYYGAHLIGVSEDEPCQRDDETHKLEENGPQVFLSRRQFAVALATTVTTAAAVLATSPTMMESSSSSSAAVAAVSTVSSTQSSPLLGLLSLFEQFDTVNDVPKSYFTKNKRIYAFVERVMDGDTIRVRHIPGFALRRQTPVPLTTRGIADQTLSIRLYGVDAPELAKTNNKQTFSQPFAQDAKDLTTSLCWHKMVQIVFLRRDQYGRAVCLVRTVPSPWWLPFPQKTKDLSMELARAGLAELYTGGGAEYGGQKQQLERLIGRAQGMKRGIWTLGSQRVSAAEEKRRLKRDTNGAPTLVKPAAVARGGKPSNGRAERVLETVVTGLEFAG